MRFIKPPISSCCLCKNCSSKASILASRLAFHIACSCASTLSACTLVFSASAYFFILARVSWIFLKLSRSLLQRGVLGSVSRLIFSSWAKCSCLCLSAKVFCKAAACFSNSAALKSHISLNCWSSEKCSSSTRIRSCSCWDRSSSRRRFSSCCRSCSNRVLANSASSYLPDFSQSMRCFSKSSRKSEMVCSSGICSVSRPRVIAITLAR
mmetsp:Transcript_35671/g.90764  ORF Transcript_35671/g.90764 Transcript_35671/m.90764 type:complete len:209 (-) Transcript_35671:74-700(-)